METTQPSPSVPPPAGELDPVLTQQFNAELKSQQNFPLALAAGLVGAVLGGIAWAVVTVITGYQIGWMAIGIGALVGYAVRVLGKGVSGKFGMTGAVLSFFGCVIGNVLSACGFLAAQQSVSVLHVTISTLTHPAVVIELIQGTFSPMDLLFYGIAVYEGYKLSFRRVTQEEIARLVKK